MQPLLRINLLWCILVCALARAESRDSSEESPILARTDVPNRVIPQGEVRLMQRDNATVVQSVLHTRFGIRVKNRITDNERNNWGDHPDARSYIEALDVAFSEYRTRRTTDGKQVALVIDFVDGPPSARVDFRFARVSREKHGFELQPSETWRSLSVSRDYLRKNQEFILADAFKEHAGEALDCLFECRLRQKIVSDE